MSKINFLDYFEKYSKIYRQMSKTELIELLAHADATYAMLNGEGKK
jgi:hypothetical protein